MAHSKNLFYAIQGKGFPIVLLHGLAASHHDWDWLAPEVIQAGYQVFTPDLPGHGDSPRPLNVKWYTLEHLYQTVLDWIDQVQVPRPFFLIGHSLGGYLSLKIAMDLPNWVSGLILTAPFYSLKQIFPMARQVLHHPTLSEQFLRLATPQMVDSILYLTAPVMGKYPPQARKQTATDYTRAIPASMRFPASAPDLTPGLTSVTAPASIIWGKNDPMLNPYYYKRLVKALPKAQGHAFPACGHEPHLACINQFNQVVLDFINTHSVERQTYFA